MPGLSGVIRRATARRLPRVGPVTDTKRTASAVRRAAAVGPQRDPLRRQAGGQQGQERNEEPQAHQQRHPPGREQRRLELGVDVAVGLVVARDTRVVVVIAVRVMRVSVCRVAGVALRPFVGCGCVSGGVVQVVDVLQRARPEEGERDRKQDGREPVQGAPTCAPAARKSNRDEVRTPLAGA
jgi:hypothetical protein